MAEMEGLSFKLVATTTEAKRGVDTLNSSLKKLNTTMSDGGTKKATANLIRFSQAARSAAKALFSMPFNKLAASVKNVASKFGSLGDKFKRILLYRGIRTIIREITQSFGEGIKNLYGWSQIADGRFAASMDRLSTSFLYFKNSIGAAVAPLINALAPAIDFVIDKAVALLNMINQLFAKLTGATYWTKANKVAKQYADNASAAGGAAKEALRYLAPFDELNRLPSDSGSGGGGGSSGSDYSDMFEIQNEFSESIANFAQMVKDAWTNGDWEEVGRFIGGKINDLIDNIDWGGIGTNVGKSINALFGVQYWTLDEINFTNLGNRIAELVNNAISHIDWDIAGRLPVKKLTSIIDTIIGVLGGLDWGQIARSISSMFSGALSEMTEWLQSKDWNQMGQNLYNNIVEFLENVDWAGVVKSIINFIGIAAQSANSFAGGILDRFMADAIFGDEMWTNLKTKFATGWNNFVDSLQDNQYVGKILDFFGIDLSGAKLEIPVTASLETWENNLTEKPWSYADAYFNWANGQQNGIGGTNYLDRPWSFADAYFNWTYEPSSTGIGGTKYMSKPWSYADAWFNWKYQPSSTGIGGTKYMSKPWSYANAYFNQGYVKVKASGGWIMLAEGGAFYNNAWHDIPQYAGGTTNAGSVFVAGEAGPELVGHIGGRTEVLNASQIASAIAAGVAGATYSYEAQGMSEEMLYNAFVRALNDSDIGGDTYLDGEAIYRSVRKHNDMNTRMTGVNAFA